MNNVGLWPGFMHEMVVATSSNRLRWVYGWLKIGIKLWYKAEVKPQP